MMRPMARSLAPLLMSRAALLSSQPLSRPPGLALLPARRFLSSSVSTATPPTLYPFDKLRMVQKLEEAGLKREQAEAVMISVAEVVNESLTAVEKRVVTKAEQDRHVYSYKADFAELKSELHMLEKNDFAILKGENERLLNELDRVKNLMREELSKLQGSIRLEMNLERGRTRDDTQTQEARIKETDNKIETEISNMRTHLETLKFDIVKYIVGSIASAAALFLTYWRIFKAGGSTGGGAAPPATG